MQQVADPLRNRSTLDLVFATALKHVRTFTESSFLGCDHLPVICTFILPFHGSVRSATARPQFMVDWGRLPNLLHKCNQDSFFLANEVQMATDKHYSIPHKCHDSITPVQIQSMPTKQNTYDRLSYKIAELRKSFLTAGDFLSLPTCRRRHNSSHLPA